jgi:hypothetical protein
VSARPAKDAYLVAETIRLRHDLPMVDTVTGVICELALVDRPTRMSSSGVIGWTGPTISSPNGTSVRKGSPVWDHTPPNPRRVRSSGYVVPKARGTGVSWRPVEAAATMASRDHRAVRVGHRRWARDRFREEVRVRLYRFPPAALDKSPPSAPEVFVDCWR